MFSWELIVEGSEARYYLESQPCYSADYQLVNVEAIPRSPAARGLCIVS